MIKKYKIKAIHPNASLFKAALALRTLCLTVPGESPISAGTADMLANMLKSGKEITVAVRDGLNVGTKAVFENSFIYEEDSSTATEQGEGMSKSSGIPTPDLAETTRKNIEMKLTSPNVKGPELPADIQLDGNIMSRVMAAALQSEVQNVINNLMPNIKQIINHEITNNFVKRLEVKVNDCEYQNIGAQHKSFPDLLRLCLIKLPDNTRINTWLVGPAGTGKTTACYNVSKAIKARTFGAIGTSDNKYELSGFVDAHGKIVNTVFKDIFINGGVMLLDEIDSWYPNALLALQAALSNGFCAFPDGVYERHEDCVVICAANTYGQGEVTEYVGRMKQDAAFLDRFVYLKWDIDESLERHIAGNKDWVIRVQSVRKRTLEKGVKVLITPRASIYGSALLSAGVPWAQVEDMVLRKSMTAEQWRSVQ